MVNELPNLLKEDQRYNLHAHPRTPGSYNLVLVYPTMAPPPPTKINQQQVISDLAKLGIKF